MATFNVNYNINPNIQLKPLKGDDGKDPIKDANGNYVFDKGDNGKYQLVFTDEKGEEHVVETEAFPFTITDGSGTTYEVTLTESNTASVAQELADNNAVYEQECVANQDSLAKFKDRILKELVNDIKTKIDMSNHMDTIKQYLHGAIDNVEFILNQTEIVSEMNAGATGWYENGKLFASYRGVATEGDVKVTIFHEYLHHINYLLKIVPYRYADESMRKIFIIEDDCFYYREQNMQEVYDMFAATLNNRLLDEHWELDYVRLSENQKNEVLAYKEKNRIYLKKLVILGNINHPIIIKMN
jgi:hypothetical protein